MRGVSTESASGEYPEHVEFTVKYADDEPHIHRRLEREKRCGIVEKTAKAAKVRSHTLFLCLNILNIPKKTINLG